MSMRTITASPVTRRLPSTRSLASWCIATGVTLAILATAPLGAQLGGSADMPGVNDRPNPSRTVEGWAQLPVGRVWGSTSAVAIDRDGVSVWVAERCGQNSCVGSELDPILLFDRTGRLVRSFGKGMINWPHGIHVDREGNVWVVDGRDNRPATRPGEPAADFRIDGPASHGVPGLVNLFGIESPGLTSSLALGAHVAALLATAA